MGAAAGGQPEGSRETPLRVPLSGGLRALPLLVLVLLGLVHVWQTTDAGMGIDFFQFWSVGQAVREHLVDDVYAPGAGPRLASIFLERAREGGRRHQAAANFRRDEIQTSNTPFLYTVFYLFESGSYETDFGRFRFLGMLLAVFSVAALCRRARYTITGTLAALAFVLWAFVPLQYDLREGNVNSVQLGAMALYLLLAGGEAPPWRRVAAGAVLALGVAFKPNLLFVPLVLVLAWVIRKEWKDLALKASGMALGSLAAIGASAAFFGSVMPWFSWVDTLRHINETFGSSVKWGSFGGGRLLLDLTGRSFSPVLYLLTLGAVAFAIWRARSVFAAASGQRAARLGEFAVLGVGPLVPLIAADLAWPHYLVQAIPVAIWLGRPRRPGAATAWLFAAALGAVCSPPVIDLFAAGSDYVYAGFLASGALLLFILGCLEIGREPEAVTPPAG